MPKNKKLKINKNSIKNKNRKQNNNNKKIVLIKKINNKKKNKKIVIKSNLQKYIKTISFNIC